MINIKDSAGLAKRAINRIVIALINYYQNPGGQGPLFIYKDIYHLAGYSNALQTAYVTKIVTRKELTDALQRCLAKKTSESLRHNSSGRSMFSL